MKLANKVFAIIFLAAYALFASNALLGGAAGVVSGVAGSFPFREGMHYYANEAAYQALPLRTSLLEGHASLQKLMGKTESGGLDVIATADGAYVEGTETSWSSYNLELFAVALHDLQESLREKGLDTKITYISAQPQIINGYTEAQEPFPLPNQDTMMESLLYFMRAYDVDFLDTQFVLGRSSVPVSEYIYRTDTKWTNQAGFATAQALIGKLNGQYEAGIDTDWQLFDENHFTFTTHEDALMGTMGMRAGRAFTGKEDFTTIVPAYETSFTYETNGGQNEPVTGSFEETLFNSEHLQPIDPYSYSAYSVYMDGGAYFQRVIINNQQPDAPKALFIHDESALPFAAFTALGFSETHMYWPELAPDSSQFNLESYIEDNGIDYVFFLAESNYYALESVFTTALP